MHFSCKFVKFLVNLLILDMISWYQLQLEFFYMEMHKNLQFIDT